MALQSRLFRGDSALEAAAVQDGAHIVKGSRGPHVAKIQTALNVLEDAGLDLDGVYGADTAGAVLSFKQKRSIINPAIQRTADDIVGILTVAALDREMAALDVVPPGPERDLQIVVVSPRNTGSSKLFAVEQRSLTQKQASIGNLQTAPASSVVRVRPRKVVQIDVKGAQVGAIAKCDNFPLKNRFFSQKIAWLNDPNNPTTGRLVPEPSGPLTPDETDGAAAFVNVDPRRLQVDCFRPGSALVTVTDVRRFQSLVIAVRADTAGPVDRPPLVKLLPNSKFISAANSGETDPNNVFHGRPVNPRGGGRMINLGGEQETPQFEDYVALLGFSPFSNSSTQGKFIFRPWTEDDHPNAFVKPASASDICIRGTPVDDETVEVIKRIAGPGCRLTFSGDRQFAAVLKAAFSQILEETPSPSGGVNLVLTVG